MDIRLGLILAFTAGAINAGGFLAVRHYTSHMTGIVSSIADYLVVHNFIASLLGAVYLFSFLSGSALSAILINWARARKLQSEYALALMLEAALLLVFGIFAARLSDALSFNITIGILCFLMGLQNAIITKISRAEIRTTHVTGLVTDIGIDIGRFVYARGSGKREIFTNADKLKLRSGLVFSFFAGGTLGAALFLKIGFAATIPFSLILAIMASGPILNDVRAKRCE